MDAELILKAANQIGISTSKRKCFFTSQAMTCQGKHESGRKGQYVGLLTSPSGLPCTGHLPEVLSKDSVASQSALRTICLRITWPQVS